MLAVADTAVEIAGERLDECSAQQAAVVAGIFTQRGVELLDEFPQQRLTIELVRDVLETQRLIHDELPRREALTAEQQEAEERWRQRRGPRPEWLDGQSQGVTGKSD